MTKRMRCRAAAVLAVLYAVCAVAPHAALAFSASPESAHCLTLHGDAMGGHDHGMAAADGHSAASDHEHANNAGGDKPSKDATAACCGLFSITALPADTRLLIGHRAEAAAVFFFLESQTAGRGPARINRPPIG